MKTTNVVIVESPAKATIIAKYLNSSPVLKHLGDFKVVASRGHVRDLAKTELSIDVKRDFAPQYVNLDEKQAVITDLRRAVKGAATVYLASDSDLEGESIAQHVVDALGLKSGTYKRVRFNEITQSALEHAFSNPGVIDQNAVQAQETRRVLDRLVGFTLSPLLWRAFSTGGASKLSAGRVQSAVLHMIVEREAQVAKFVSAPFWTVRASDVVITTSSSTKNLTFPVAKLHAADGSVFRTDAEPVALLNAIATAASSNSSAFRATAHIATLATRKEKPPAPYTTSTLQQDASAKLGMSIARTMSLAQELYEAGLITYMRTDSTRISVDAKKSISAYVQKTFGDAYVGSGGAVSAGGAHEAIRPTKVDRALDQQGPKAQLYALIRARAIASVMAASVRDVLTFAVHVPGLPDGHAFHATCASTRFDGHLRAAFAASSSRSKRTGANKTVVEFDGDVRKLASGTNKFDARVAEISAVRGWTSPPQRYGEAAMIKTMEREGIGRPSTYVATLAKLYERQYVAKKDVPQPVRESKKLVLAPGKSVRAQTGNDVASDDSEDESDGDQKAGFVERGKLVPTEIGAAVDGFMCAKVRFVCEKGFTAQAERHIDAVAEGKESRSVVLADFWKRIEREASEAQADVSKRKKTVIKRPETQHVMKDGQVCVSRIARYGPVLQCPDAQASKGVRYVDLRGFLKNRGKDAIDDKEAEFLVSLPMKVFGTSASLHNGPYSFYLKDDATGKTAKLPRSFAKAPVEKLKALTDSDVRGAFEYADAAATKKAKSSGGGKVGRRKKSG
jgi:DNA topoisomerase I